MGSLSGVRSEYGDPEDEDDEDGEEGAMERKEL